LTVQATKATRSQARLLLVIAATAGLVLSMALSARGVLAGEEHPLVDPVTTGQATNPDCDDLVEDAFIDGYDAQDKYDPPESGSGDHSSIEVDGSFVAFEADEGWLVVAAIIKGGEQGANVYVYDGFPGGGVAADWDLVTPDNPNDEPAGLSHVTLCLVEAPEETSTQTPEGSQLGGTGTPAPSIPNTAFGMAGFSGPLATVVFGAILLASLGTLAYANVRSVRRRG